MSMDRLREIETFVAVAAKGSFAGTADEQGVTPVMVGRRVTQLEKRLGGPLFHRTTRKLTLTPQGEQYLKCCKGILARLTTAERLVADGRNYATGHLVISGPTAFGRRHVAPHLREFIAANPDVKISLNLNDQVIDLVRSGYELGIRIGPILDPNLVPVRLAQDRPVVCGTPAYFRRFGVPKSLDDLSRHNCLVFNESGGQQQGWLFRVGDEQVALKMNGAMSCNDGSLLTHWVREGVGIAWRSRWEVADELASGDLVAVLGDYTAFSYDIMAVYPLQKHLPAKITMFIDWLKSIYGQPAHWMRGSELPGLP